ncbi:hypothetical protein C0J52_04920 [Blattella germanica]|nr:hypothetical protein C0J52_04920 [Blattella germanica]
MLFPDTMQSSTNRLIVDDIAFKKHLQERNCSWLPVPLPVACDVPSDVALWLFELRHFNDSCDVPENLKLSVECDALINELWFFDNGSSDDGKVVNEVRCAAEDLEVQERQSHAEEANSKPRVDSPVTIEENDSNQTALKEAVESENLNSEQKITDVTNYGDELARQTQRTVAGILWEANPLYSNVGDERGEGSGRGFRKLCHSSIEELGNTLSLGPGEQTSECECPNNQLKQDSLNADLNEQTNYEGESVCVSSATIRLSVKFTPSDKRVTKQERETGAETITATTNSNNDNVTSVNDSCNSETVCEQNPEIQISKLKSNFTEATNFENPLYDAFETESKQCPIDDSDYENVGNICTKSSIDDTIKISAKMSYDEQCEEVLHDLELVIQSLEIENNISEDFTIEPDNEFLELCQEADCLAEESIQQCPPVIPKVKKSRSFTMSSDISDEVFVNSPSTEESITMFPTVTEIQRRHSLDINTIFDDGTTPPVPPVRKKRNKDRYKTAHDIQCSTSETSEKSVNKPSDLESETNDNSANEAKESTEGIKNEVVKSEIETEGNVDESSVNKDSTDGISDPNNLLNFENETQELIIIKRVTDMTKEKRSAKVASQYEDANACCQCQAGECDLSCSLNSQIPIPKTPSPSPSSGERSSAILDSPKVDDENRQELGITLTPLRPIYSSEFPPPSVVINECTEMLQSDSHAADGKSWFSSNDSQGRIYFFEENSNESSWTLPEIAINVCDTSTPAKSTPKDQQPMGAKKPAKEEKQLEGDVQLRSDPLGTETEAKVQYRMAKAHSMALLESTIGKQASSKSSSIPRNWPDWTNGEMCVLKEATLNRTKITENGKKLRKNWAPAHVVLTEPFLLFFKDAKTFSAMKNPQGESSSAARPEFTVDLNGALLENGEKASSRRNVFLVSTVLGLQVLLQCENSTQADEWYQAIHKAITDLPSAYDSCPRNKTPKLSPPYLGSHSPDEFKKSSRIGRSRSVKSVKLSTKDGSLEDLTVSPDENQTKIKNRLKKFFHRRPTKEVLVKKGIYKDEPVFGCLLSDVCKGESPRVPQFVQRCVAAIECKEENMKTDGLYLNHNKKEKLQQFREIVKALPHPNRDTLEFLLRHLLRVTGFQEFNRMHIPNLAIVFGPTLMWPEAESQNMALDLMQQNLVIECFLQEFESIFR